MGALCSAMADLLAGEGEGEERPEKKAEGEDECWEKEVNMDVFYTDAEKYWEVRNNNFSACKLCVRTRAGNSSYR